jgi:archaetidylinositol phosphate synthase
VTLDALRPAADRAVAPFVRAADRLGIGSNAVSVVGFGLAVAAAGVFAATGRGVGDVWLVPGAALLLASGWLDVLDGALAREQGTDSRRGDLLDHVLDRYADVAVVTGLAVATGRYGLGLAAVTGVLLTSYLGTQAQAVGVGRVYAGAIGRADRLALVTIAAVVAAATDATLAGLGALSLVLVVLAVAGHLTALQRFAGAWRALD